MSGLRLVDVGGGFSGLPFVLSKGGADVTIVDPFLAYGLRNPYEGQSPPDVIRRLNRAYRTNVDLIQSTLEHADIPNESCDRVICVSVIEHLDESARQSLMREVERILKPCGEAVFTVDLFLDLQPFTNVKANQYGSNVSIRELVDATQLGLYFGDRSELYGYDEFDSSMIMSRRSQFAEGKYPVVAQAFALRRVQSEAAQSTT